MTSTPAKRSSHRLAPSNPEIKDVLRRRIVVPRTVRPKVKRQLNRSIRRRSRAEVEAQIEAERELARERVEAYREHVESMYEDHDPYDDYLTYLKFMHSAV
jgi:hypothetical protein